MLHFHHVDSFLPIILQLPSPTFFSQVFNKYMVTFFNPNPVHFLVILSFVVNLDFLVLLLRHPNKVIPCLSFKQAPDNRMSPELCLVSSVRVMKETFDAFSYLCVMKEISVHSGNVLTSLLLC